MYNVLFFQKVREERHNRRFEPFQERDIQKLGTSPMIIRQQSACSKLFAENFTFIGDYEQ